MNSLAGVTTLCFSASYLVALAADLWRWRRRAGGRATLAPLAAAAGLVAHTLFLWNRAAEHAGRPLSSPFDWYLVAAWGVAAFYLYLALHQRSARVGLFLLPLALLLVAASRFASREAFAAATAATYWRWLHSVALLLGVVSILVGFAAGVMYLVQAWRLKHHRPPDSGLTLPSLERLDQLAGRASVATAALIGVGFISGLVLNQIAATAAGRVVSWSDPTVWSLGVMFLWVMVAAAFSFFYRPARHGRKAAYLALASFALLVLMLSLMLAAPTQHPMAPEQAGAALPAAEGAR